ncbi:flavin-containing monooxygenase [Nocardioides marmorisolisilvae]|uniref:NAD(P)/FAD-dependent oxidoreductase n=1 Tax=Nocardioides marmorisolisilvae TaxID=1542737 RepID=A0A3N0DTC4_9ACTN|nr:NAD(P)/FAD-dependent oxidoreductase [Nocardioides marmorisolisilvae]RNL78840.1 NAD(P)/FAD-dependent oxidoreductase [Nocardioides marmorisolisilvae]
MTSPRILIIGAGFGGLGTAIELLDHGFTDVTILEKAEDLGGVWRDNTYPNAACDVPSSLYSWSFAPKPDWPRRYSGQADILGYIRAVADERGLTERIRTGVEVTAASYDDATATWRVETADGDTYDAEFLVSAVGQLSRPVIPEIPGADSFAGPAFHSAQWDHDVDLRGKRVAVLGTGASAIQFVPGIQPVAGAVTVFQRSAPYVVPKADRAYTRTHQRTFARYPRSQAFGRKLTWVMSEQLNKSLVGTNPMKKVLEAAWKVHLRRQIPDPELRAKLRPDYPIGCKRLLFSNDWYPALAAENVDVVTEHVVEVLPDAVRTADGVVHPCDVIIYGTGFAATEFLAPMKITGSHGADLNEVWAEGARAYLGICLPGFPNFGIVYGPNTNLGGSSIINMMESQSAFIRQLVEVAAATGSVAVREDAASTFDTEVQQRLAASVWGGCSSWYRDEGGRVTTNWPGTVVEYKARTETLDLADFEVAAPA